MGLLAVLALAPRTWSEAPRAPAADDVPVIEISMAPGETLEALAERLYGTRRIAPLLARAGWPAAAPETGARVEVPLARRHPLPRGGSLSRLAAAHCGSRERWPILAALSGIDRPRGLAPGTPVVLPARLVIRVRRGDSLGRLAYLAWGETRGAELLARWNGLDTTKPLHVGQRLEVPLGGPLGEP